MSRLSSPWSAGNLGTPLPMPNSLLSQVGVVHRRQQFSLWAAAPGVGKTLWAFNYALRAKVQTLYFSADSDEWTVRQRACSVLTGTSLEKVEEQLNSDSWLAYYTDTLMQADHIDFCYQSDIEPEFIVKRLQAHAEIYGEYPRLIVVDNLGNTVSDQDNEYAELRGVCRELQRIARNTGAHVMGLHHVLGAKENGHDKIGLADLLGKLGKIPEQVFGLCKEQGDRRLILTVPKNRGGKSGLELYVPVDYDTATIGGYPYAA